MDYLLSILIPTYNRSGYLDRLLFRVGQQIRASSLCNLVEVIVGNNASTDETQSVIDGYIADNPNFFCLSHSVNLGAESNMISLVKRASGRFFWFIGDDDLPVGGLLASAISQLSLNSPSLVYLPSIWNPDIGSIDLGLQDNFTFVQWEPLAAAQNIHVWTTFISSWIFSASLVSSPEVLLRIESTKGSNLPQLGWILPLLTQSHARVLVASQPCILATSGNTGGYSILTTFLANYPSLVNLYTQRRPWMQRALVGNAVRSYMPSLILSVKSGQCNSDRSESLSVALKSIRFLWAYPSFWVFCIPALLLPKGLIAPLRIAVMRMNDLLRPPTLHK